MSKAAPTKIKPDTVNALFAPLNVPRPLRRPVGLLGAKLLAGVGPVVRFIEGGLPPSEAFAVPAWHPLGRRLQHAEAGVRTLREFSRHDWRWYSHLVRAGDQHAPMAIGAVACPVTFVSGTFDVLASSKDIRAVAERHAGARMIELPGSHYLPLEFPDVLRRELNLLIRSP